MRLNYYYLNIDLFTLMNNLVTEQQHFFSKPLSIFTKDSDTSLSSFDEKEDSML